MNVKSVDIPSVPSDHEDKVLASHDPGNDWLACNRKMRFRVLNNYVKSMDKKRSFARLSTREARIRFVLGTCGGLTCCQ